MRGDVDLDGDVDSNDKSSIQNNYQGTTLGRGQLSGWRNVLGWVGQEWEPVLSELYLAGERPRNSSLGRSQVRFRGQPEQALFALNRYESRRPRERHKARVATLGGGGPVPATSASGSAQAPFVASQCNFPCPLINFASQDPPTAVWAVADLTTALEEALGAPCRVQTGLKIRTFDAEGSPVKLQCPINVDLPEGSLCHGWHGDEKGPMTKDKIAWFANPARATSDMNELDTASSHDQNELYPGECINCGGGKPAAGEDLEYIAISATDIVPIVPTETQVLNHLQGSVPDPTSHDLIVAKMHRSYVCGREVNTSVDSECAPFADFGIEMPTGCPITN